MSENNQKLYMHHGKAVRIICFAIYTKLPNGQFLSWNVISGKITTKKTWEDFNIKTNKFQVPKGYETVQIIDGQEVKCIDEEGLMRYVKDFKTWNWELQKHSIMYSNYSSDVMAGLLFFQRNASKYFIIGNKEKGTYNTFIGHDDIDFVEYRWIQNCYNAGNMYFNDKYKDKEVQCYSYDFNMNYPRLLGETGVDIPTKKGKETTLTELPVRGSVQMGYYHVRITSNSQRMKKLFSFSPSHTYTHLDLEFAMKEKERSDRIDELNNKDTPTIEIELIQDGKPNAYLYDENNVVNTKEIFSQWLSIILMLRKQHPQNKLVKSLSKMVWGILCKKNTVNKSREEILEEKLSITYTDEFGYLGNDKKQYVALNQYNTYEIDEDGMYVLKEGKTTLLNAHKPFKCNIRIKAFLTSTARQLIASVAKQDLKNVVRMQTDCVSFKKKQNFDSKYPTLFKEEKTSGRILWHNVNRYEKME